MTDIVTPRGDEKGLQEVAYGAMMEEMKEERDKLMEHFNKDTDLQ